MIPQDIKHILILPYISCLLIVLQDAFPEFINKSAK